MSANPKDSPKMYLTGHQQNPSHGFKHIKLIENKSGFYSLSLVINSKMLTVSSLTVKLTPRTRRLARSSASRTRLRTVCVDILRETQMFDAVEDVVIALTVRYGSDDVVTLHV